MFTGPSFFWFDFETFGTDPARDRAAQFAGVRTDADLNPIEEPLVIYAKPADDMLPHPEACLITDITPQDCWQKGLPEAEFIKQIHHALSRPGTCSLGYNSIRFDDEVIRHTLYRNFFDAYAREWQHGNSRWDLLDVVRACYALRLPGIEWPKDEQGKVSFRLEALAKANGLQHEKAHDALSDVYATIALAKKIKSLHPELFEQLFALRHKRQVSEGLDVQSMKPVAHVSGMFSVEQGCLAIVAPLAYNPKNRNAVIAWDLSADPSPLLALDADAIRHRVFTAADQLQEERLPLKQIHINRAPVLLPMSQISPEIAQHWQLDGDRLRAHLKILREAVRAPGAKATLENTLATAFAQTFEPITDPDLMLYSGGFFSDQDKRTLAIIREQPPEMLAEREFLFEDERLDEMLFRYRARNYPDTLNSAERQRWEIYRRQKLLPEQSASGLTFPEFARRLEMLGAQAQTSHEVHIIQELVAYGEAIYPYADH